MTDRKAHDVRQITSVNPEKIAYARKLMKTDAFINRLAESFGILSDPTRLKIVLALSHQELCVCDLAELIGLSESAISHQLRLLRGFRVVRYRREGKIAYYTLDDRHIERLLAEGLRHMEA